MDEFLHKALHVDETDEDIDFNSAPSTGQEYLRRVISEARKCESTVVADTKRMKIKPQTVRYTYDNGCPRAPEGFAPSLQCQQLVVSKFSDVRNAMSQHSARMKQEGQPLKLLPNLPVIDNESEWAAFCFGKPNEQHYSGTPPLITVVLPMNQFMVEKLLEYHVGWLERHDFTKPRGQWLYALLAKLEKPLKPEMCSILRTLARLCAAYRAKLTSEQDPLLSQLNMFICLVGRYFDQTDMADP